ncbi:MAG: esterase-like activity of phytase family protein, partial [Bacteroidota bacterium]|nr:esterase-like activity of phytase family protein [Bacteroidota bacterium]
MSEYEIPFNQQFQHTIIGGLSGIDYNAKKNEYYIVSDDRSEKNPARFYKARIIINKDKIDSVIFLETIFLRDKEGNLYPGILADPYYTPDPEALRCNPLNNTFTWSSEGERIVKPGNVVLEDPSVT